MEIGTAANLERLKRRGDFIAVKKGGRVHGRAFVLQAIKRPEQKLSSSENAPARFGITVTKRVGNSVVRNRIKRRLRELIRLHGAKYAQTGTDYVLIARNNAIQAPFFGLVDEFYTGLKRIRQLNRSRNH